MICLVGLLVRLVYVTAAHSYRFRPLLDHFEFGWEAGRVGRSLALGRGFADPFVPSGTGPTAWLPPLYPMIIGAVFRVFGVYSPLSGWVLLAINSVFGSATVPAVYEIAKRCFGASGQDSRRGRSIALGSAWIWALYPATMQYSVRWIWETSLTTFLVAWALVVTLRLRDAGNGRRPAVRDGWGLWIWLGLLWGLIGLSNATPLLLFPVCVVWVIVGVHERRRAMRGAVLAGVIFVLCLAPWTWRNWRVFHAFIPIRGNLGAELWVHNGPQANGFPRGIVVFSQPELRGYTAMGEMAYVRERGEWAREYILSHPGRFLELSLERVYWFWMNLPHPLEDHPFSEAVREVSFGFLSVTGCLGLLLAIRRRVTGAWLFAAAFMLIPVTYYFVTVGARFRHPLEPLLVILSVYLFASAERRPLTGEPGRPLPASSRDSSA
jgi:Dolichyl-phosphate-mannose-protein mannosyltransferase